MPNVLGWVIDLELPYATLAEVATLALGACLVASLLPAQRAMRLVPADALRQE